MIFDDFIRADGTLGFVNLAQTFSALVPPLVYEGNKAERDLAHFLDPQVTITTQQITPNTEVRWIAFSDGSVVATQPGHSIILQGTIKDGTLTT